MCSLDRWIDPLKRNRNRLWDKRKKHVKDFRSCEDFADTVLDGHILSALSACCGVSHVAELVAALSTDPEKISNGIHDLAQRTSKFNFMPKMRAAKAPIRDVLHEQHICFMQHGLTLRSFATSCRQGDSGRVVTVLKYYCVWFQGSKQHNYAKETLHLLACLKFYWSDEYKRFWMNTCLVNMSGKREGFLACDGVCEHCAREVKVLLLHRG
jgi:hypothetical protein